MTNDLVSAFVALDDSKVMAIANGRIKDGDDPVLLFRDFQKGIKGVMKKYETREYFLDSVVSAFDMYESIRPALDSLLPEGARKTLGVIVIGTVQYDIHDIGKDLVASLLRTIGFEIHDLGVDVPPEKFVEELKRTGASILGLSGMISACYESMKETVKAIREAGINPKIVIGGGAACEALRKYVQADAYTQDMVEGAQICLDFARSNGMNSEVWND